MNLDEIKVKGLNGAEVGFGDLLKDAKVIVVFLRHFGWYCLIDFHFRVFCRELATEFMKYNIQFEEKYDMIVSVRNWRLIFMGSGTIPMAKEFQKEYIKNEAIPIYIDQKLTLYTALEFNRMSVLDVLSWTVLSGGKRAYGKGFSQGTLQGDTFQLGGMFMFDNKSIVYSHTEKHAGELPDFDLILKKL
jgi:hypothetical protein